MPGAPAAAVNARLVLAEQIPTWIPDLLRALAGEAERRAADPVNVLDDNPAIAREWAIVATELDRCAALIEVRFLGLFKGL